MDKAFVFSEERATKTDETVGFSAMRATGRPSDMARRRESIGSPLQSPAGSVISLDDLDVQRAISMDVQRDARDFVNGAGAGMEADEDGESHEVILHVYDLGPVTGKLNEFVLRGANLGAFHCGVEVLGDEWSFQGFVDAWDNPELSGVVRNEPQNHPAYIYRESISLGRTNLSPEAVDLVLDTMMEQWPANAYHLVARNCVTFAEELCTALGAPEPFPAWVRGAVDAGKTPAIFAVADYGWSWFTWWCKRQCELEAAAEAREAAELAESAEAETAADAAPQQRHGGSAASVGGEGSWTSGWQAACGFELGRCSVKVPLSP